MKTHSKKVGDTVQFIQGGVKVEAKVDGFLVPYSIAMQLLLFVTLTTFDFGITSIFVVNI
jgi:hypothetical protein